MGIDRPIILALQYYHGDQEAANRNARRIADNELEFRKDVEFCFVTRVGTEHDKATVEHVSKKFKTSTIELNRRGAGWPQGPNDVWTGLMQESLNRVRDGEWTNAKAIFTFESDCIPVHQDWINRLHAEWELTEKEGKWMCGWVGHGPHLNGNGLFHPSLGKFIRNIYGCPANVAWDWHFRKTFEPHWRQANFLENLYNQRGVPKNQLQDIVSSGVTCIHGVKDSSVEAFADTLLRKS
jgi:hypothetical protein